ncbi:MAG: NAD-dependent epimerase/dehydratase family protein [bacterium]|nr:NAD-dependent epimerase/dehydratase family protein [bacterium]
MNDNLLIIGGSGFVSGTMARRAVAAGWDVWVVTRGQRTLPAGVHAIVADRKQTGAFAAQISAAMKGAGIERFDLVADCIGYDVDDALQDVAVFRDRARQLVFVSTDFVFDPVHRHFPQGETSAHYLPDGYGGNKRLCEMELLRSACGDMSWTVVRPCHIYGPGSLLGCLPTHGRDKQLLKRLRAGEALRLVGGGHFLQQPILAQDLADLMLGMVHRTDLHQRIFQAAGPDVVESVAYYRIIADIVGVELGVEELPVGEFLAQNPASASFLCHRIYDLGNLQQAALPVPATPLRTGLAQQVAALDAQ